MKYFIQHLICLLFILNYIVAEEFTVTTIIKNRDSYCSTGTTGTNTNENACSCTENSSMQARLEKLETLFRENRVTLCGSGMQDYRISDDQLSASDYHNRNINDVHSFLHGRLFFRAEKAQAWVAKLSDPEKWIQVDFNRNVKIVGVVTQGRPTYDQWVTLYKVQYKSSDADEFQFVQQNPFPGNVDRNTISVTSFPEAIEGRFFRIKVIEWHGHPSMRFDFLIC